MVSTIWFSGMSDIVVCPENTLNIAVLLKPKMVAICARTNHKSTLFSTEYKQIDECGAYHRVFRHARHSDVTRK